MRKSQTGDSAGEAIIIIAFVVYMTFISYMMYAVYGDSIPIISLTDFSLPGWLIVISGAWLVWLFEVLGNFFILLTFTIIGHGIPLWLNAFFTLPLVIGLGWIIASLIRGR